jgi:hypothetical protein
MQAQNYYPAPSAPPSVPVPQVEYTYVQMPTCLLCNTQCTTRYTFPCQQEHFVHQQCYQYHSTRYAHLEPTKCHLCQSVVSPEPDPPFIGGVAFYPAAPPVITIQSPTTPYRTNRKKIVCATICCITVVAASTLPFFYFFIR